MRDDLAAVRELYLMMPGAPMPPKDKDGFYVWGDVADGNEHWAFCVAIVRMMRREAGEAVGALAASHNLV
jgi:hypothetical protein